MARFGFCSGTYQSESVNVDAERCVNLYPEINGQNSSSAVALYTRPGKVNFCNLGTGPVGGLFTYQPSGSPFPRVFGVASSFVEIFQDGTTHDYGFVATELPVTMAANNANQVITCTGGDLWLFDTTTNTATQVATNLGKIFASVAFLNGYFLALQQNSQTVWFSAIEDGTSWDALDFFAVNWYPDNVASMFVDHGQIWLLGPKQTVVYYNTTDPLNPFLPIQSSYIQHGIAAEFSIVALDNSIFWIGADERGQGIGWRANGYTPQRVTTHAVENAWRQYPQISDAVAFSYQENGHSFWQIYFPAGNATWVYDCASGMWHERTYWNGTKEVADRARCHVFVDAWNKHLLGDTLSGEVFDSSLEYLTDFGHPIRKYRRAPHICNEFQRYYHKQLQVHLETGLVSIAEGSAPPYIVLADNTGQQWKIWVDDNYLLNSQMVSGAQLTPTITIESVNGTYWVLGVEAGTGRLITTQTTDSSSATFAYQLVTVPGQLPAQIQIQDSQDRLQTAVGYPVVRGPLVWLRWSDDGGHTWKSEQYRDAGSTGEYAKRVIWRRLGKSRDRVYEFGCSDPVSIRVVDAYLWADLANTPGYSLPTERISAAMRKGA